MTMHDGIEALASSATVAQIRTNTMCRIYFFLSALGVMTWLSRHFGENKLPYVQIAGVQAADADDDRKKHVAEQCHRG